MLVMVMIALPCVARPNLRASPPIPDYGVNRGVFGDCHTADAFAVSGVGAAAEDCANCRSEAVADERAMETGVFKKVFFDDGAHVFVVRDMFRENNQRYGDEQKRDCADARAVGALLAVFEDEFEQVEILFHNWRAEILN